MMIYIFSSHLKDGFAFLTLSAERMTIALRSVRITAETFMKKLEPYYHRGKWMMRKEKEKRDREKKTDMDEWMNEWMHECII